MQKAALSPADTGSRNSRGGLACPDLGKDLVPFRLTTQLLSGTRFPLFLVVAPLKMVFPKKGSLFSRVAEQLRLGLFGWGVNHHGIWVPVCLSIWVCRALGVAELCTAGFHVCPSFMFSKKKVELPIVQCLRQ